MGNDSRGVHGVMGIVIESGLSIPVQILAEVVYISQSINTLRKSMNLIIPVISWATWAF